MDIGSIYETVGTPVGSTGVQFVMAVSLGQVILFVLTAVGFIAGVGKLYATVSQTKKAVDKNTKDMETFRASMASIERRHQENVDNCREEHREQMLQMRGSLDNLHQAMYSALRIDNRARGSRSIEKDHDAPLSE